MKKETVLWAMLATATYATAQNGKFPTSGVSADSVQTEKDSIKANQEAEIKADKEAERADAKHNRIGSVRLKMTLAETGKKLNKDATHTTSSNTSRRFNERSIWACTKHRTNCCSD